MLKDKNYKIDKDRIVYREIEQEMVILDLETGFYYSLDEIGAKIWQTIVDGKSIGQALIDIEEIYSVTQEKLSVDVENVLNDLVSEKLLNVS